MSSKYISSKSARTLSTHTFKVNENTHGTFNCNKCGKTFTRVISGVSKDILCARCVAVKRATGIKRRKELSQDDFSAKIIREVEIVSKNRYAIFECPECLSHFKLGVQTAKRKKVIRCKKCSQPKQGRSKHPLYATWKMMLYRCNNKNATAYHRYGGRGIKVSSEFYDFNSFVSACELHENCCKDGYTLDRIDPDGHYTVDNIQFATQTTQSQKSSLLRSTNRSGYRGVSFFKGRYVAQITVNYEHSNLGIFDTAIEAARAYNKYVISNNLKHTLNSIT